MKSYQFVLLTIGLLFAAPTGDAADFRSANFIVSAPSEEEARETAMVAEAARAHLATEWLGRELPQWNDPCRISVAVTASGSQGYTSYVFEHGTVRSWEMEVRGSLHSLHETILPHEVCHTVLVTQLRRRLPRWIDEGIAVTAEHRGEQFTLFNRCVKSVDEPQWIPLPALFAMKEYPEGNVLQFYYEAAAVVQYLLWRGECEGWCLGHPRPAEYARQKLLAFERYAHQTKNWDSAVRMYGFCNVAHLECCWRQALRMSSRVWL